MATETGVGGINVLEIDTASPPSCLPHIRGAMTKGLQVNGAIAEIIRFPIGLVLAERIEAYVPCGYEICTNNIGSSVALEFSYPPRRRPY